MGWLQGRTVQYTSNSSIAAAYGAIYSGTVAIMELELDSCSKRERERANPEPAASVMLMMWTRILCAMFCSTATRSLFGRAGWP